MRLTDCIRGSQAIRGRQWRNISAVLSRASAAVRFRWRVLVLVAAAVGADELDGELLDAPVEGAGEDAGLADAADRCALVERADEGLADVDVAGLAHAHR